MPTYPVASTPGITADGTMDPVTPLAGVTGGQTFPCLAGIDCAIRFRATMTALQVLRYLDGDMMRLCVDGHEDGRLGSTPSSLAIPNSGTWGTVEFDGLDGTAEHEYVVTSCGLPGNHDAVAYVYSLTPLGGDINPAALAGRPLDAYYGDSIWAGLSGTGNDSGRAVAHRMGRDGTRASRNLGLAGSTVHDYGLGTSNPAGGLSGERRTAQVTGLLVHPATVWILYGFNDANQNNGAETDVEFGASYIAMLESLLAGLPSFTVIRCLGLLPPTAQTPANARANRTSFNRAIQVAATALLAAYPGRTVTYVPTDSWPLALLGGVHPYPGDYAMMEAEMRAVPGAAATLPTRRTAAWWWLGGLARRLHPVFQASTRAQVSDTTSGARAAVSGA